MSEKSLKLTVDGGDLESLLALVALGTVTAILAGSISPDNGIWSLGLPVTRDLPARMGLLSPELAEILAGADEWSVLEKLAGRAALERHLKAVATSLHVILSKRGASVRVNRNAE